MNAVVDTDLKLARKEDTILVRVEAVSPSEVEREIFGNIQEQHQALIENVLRVANRRSQRDMTTGVRTHSTMEDFQATRVDNDHHAQLVRLNGEICQHLTLIRTLSDAQVSRSGAKILERYSLALQDIKAQLDNDKAWQRVRDHFIRVAILEENATLTRLADHGAKALKKLAKDAEIASEAQAAERELLSPPKKIQSFSKPFLGGAVVVGGFVVAMKAKTLALKAGFSELASHLTLSASGLAHVSAPSAGAVVAAAGLGLIAARFVWYALKKIAGKKQDLSMKKSGAFSWMTRLAVGVGCGLIVIGANFDKGATVVAPSAAAVVAPAAVDAAPTVVPVVHMAEHFDEKQKAWSDLKTIYQQDHAKLTPEGNAAFAHFLKHGGDKNWVVAGMRAAAGDLMKAGNRVDGIRSLDLLNMIKESEGVSYDLARIAGSPNAGWRQDYSKAVYYSKPFAVGLN